jgi:dephospho-CoA kinase
MSDLTFHHAQRPLRIGITGGIGSGKTTVCHIFESLGIPVYYADYWAKWLLENDPELQKKIVELFGEKAYINGMYNKSLIAEQVFSNSTKLAQLNAIAHPAVELHSREWHAKQKNVPYTLKEAALIIETGGQHFLDALILVTAPEEIRINRVMQRDGSSKDAVLHRMSNQMPEADKLKYADFIIKNDGQELLIPQVLKIHQYLLR